MLEEEHAGINNNAFYETVGVPQQPDEEKLYWYFFTTTFTLLEKKG